MRVPRDVTYSVIYLFGWGLSSNAQARVRSSAGRDDEAAETPRVARSGSDEVQKSGLLLLSLTNARQLVRPDEPLTAQRQAPILALRALSRPPAEG
jgi:hypothetical protein